MLILKTLNIEHRNSTNTLTSRRLLAAKLTNSLMTKEIFPAKLPHVPKWALWLAPLLAFALIAKKMNQNPPVNFARTAPDAPNAELRTRFSGAPWSQVVGAAQSALGNQKTYGRAWKTGQNSIVGAMPGETLREELRAEVPVLLFTDDLVVTVSEQEGGKIRVDCASKARLGRGDFGENQRHVLQFLRSFDEKMAE